MGRNERVLILTVKVIEYDNMEYTNRGMVMVMNPTSDFVHDSNHTFFGKLESLKEMSDRI